MSKESLSRLEAGRKELLDLGLRNPLINHRQRAKQVKIVDELSTEVYRILVVENKMMSFDASPEVEEEKPEEIKVDNDDVEIEGETETETDESSDDTENNNSDSLEDELIQPDEDLEDGELAARHIDSKLQSNLIPKKLQTRLLSIHNDSRTYLEEQGVNILFLALGFLHWYEAPSSQEVRRAPLILIPVEIKRANAQDRFHVTYTGEDISDNLSLSEKLKAEFNIQLPIMEDVDELDVVAYFNSIDNTVNSDERWHVDTNEMTLGFFSFGKFLMYKDLDAKEWPEDSKGGGFSVLDSLLTDGFREPESLFNEETHIDEAVSPSDVHQVKDADSTQILAILDVNTGRNLVLQGPPGTGKSQTITNIIAECIGNNRKVLFVSEKMAALDVVKRRLDEVGLGDAVLELHSHKTNKKLVLAELNRTLHQGKPVVQNPVDDIKTLTILRDKLNAYCEAVNQLIGNTHTSFINALGFSIKAKPEVDLKVFDFNPMDEWTESDYRTARMQVETLDRHLAEAGSPINNPFRASKLTEFLPSEFHNIEKALEIGRGTTHTLLSSAVQLAQSMGIKKPEYRDEVKVICRAAHRAMEAPHLEGLCLTSEQWQAKRDDLNALITAGKKLYRAHADYDEWLIDEAWQQDIIEVRQHYVTKGHKWWRFLSGDFRRAKSRMQGLCRKPLEKDVDKTIEMIDTILDSQKHGKIYKEHSELGALLFGAQWKKENSDWEVLEKLTEWIITLYRDVGKGVVSEGIVNFLSGSPKLDKLKQSVVDVENKLAKHEQNMSDIVDSLQLKVKAEAKIYWGLTLEKQSHFLAHWRKHLSSLYDLVRFNQLSDDMSKNGLSFVVAAVKNWEQDEQVLVKLFDYSWYSGLLEKAYIDMPSIKMFDQTEHAHIQEEFSRLDHLLFEHNQVRLASKHWQSLPKLSDGGQLHIINREINKKRRHMPIRKLISEAGRAIQAIKPVFMMSPMSIATYVPPGSVEFDLVVFDEASQVKPVDAFGAIIRGHQTVVVGDSKQLPPTSFFDSLVESDDDEDDFENIGDMESILSLFLGKGAPERMLRWHYRSRHDSLIAVSNNEFYDNRLIVFPSPGINPIARGLRLLHLPDTSYDRGKTRSNPDEAKAVAKAVLDHAKTNPDLTLGVVAFSTAQRDAVEVQLEILRRNEPGCESFFSENVREPFFVKNLENVQGDERDIIFISIGYGKTSEGYMAMSFGPLNRDGGERRLNVLISRARLAMDVFSNFTDDDIDLNRTKARGVVALKNFLAYARTGIIQQPYSTGKEPNSPFEEEVIKALQQNGIMIEPQVGSSGFFIDLAVKDPDNPGRYILGIECDGATYHSSRSARDRDRLRQEVLEGLGWRIHRIWSTEWYRNQEKEVERTLLAIQKAGQDYRNGVEVEPEQVAVNKKTTSIVREEVTQQDNESNRQSIEYKRVALNIDLGNKELHELTAQQLFGYISAVVEVESPVHKTEITRRITEGAGLKRAGKRIQTSVSNAIRYGVQASKIQLKGDFVWLSSMEKAEVRNRSELDSSSKRFDYVPPEEISAAILQEVERGFSLAEDEAMSNAAGAMGFHRLTAQSKKLFETQLSLMIENKSLEKRDGFISIVH